MSGCRCRGRSPWWGWDGGRAQAFELNGEVEGAGKELDAKNVQKMCLHKIISVLRSDNSSVNHSLSYLRPRPAVATREPRYAESKRESFAWYLMWLEWFST